MSKKPDTKGHILHEMSIIGKSIEKESRLVVAGGWGKWETELMLMST